MPRKTYVHRSTFEILSEVDDHRDVNFPSDEWSREPAGLASLLATAVPQRYWTFDPPGSDALREMTPAEKAGVNSDPARLAAARVKRRAELQAELASFLESRYPSRIRAAFAELRNGATGATATALDNYFTWHRRAWAAYRAALTTINAATNITVIEATSIGTAPLVAQDPLVDIDQAAS